VKKVSENAEDRKSEKMKNGKEVDWDKTVEIEKGQIRIREKEERKESKGGVPLTSACSTCQREKV
jgi:hypothetical protein